MLLYHKWDNKIYTNQRLKRLQCLGDIKCERWVNSIYPSVSLKLSLILFNKDRIFKLNKFKSRKLKHLNPILQQPSYFNIYRDSGSHYTLNDSTSRFKKIKLVTMNDRNIHHGYNHDK